jgi:hypothetical protein
MLLADLKVFGRGVIPIDPITAAQNLQQGLFKHSISTVYVRYSATSHFMLSKKAKRAVISAWPLPFVELPVNCIVPPWMSVTYSVASHCCEPSLNCRSSVWKAAYPFSNSPICSTSFRTLLAAMHRPVQSRLNVFSYSRIGVVLTRIDLTFLGWWCGRRGEIRRIPN